MVSNDGDRPVSGWNAGVANEVRAAVARDDAEAIGRLLVERPLEMWFDLPPADLYRVLASLPPAVAQRIPVVGVLLRVFAPKPMEAQVVSDPALTAVIDSDPELRRWLVVVQAVQARIEGRPVESHDILMRIPSVAEAVVPVIDNSFGLRTFLFMQTALSAALAGRFTDALSFWAKSLLVPPPSGLAFFAREAHVRTALIHAIYGDRERAAISLGHAREVARTSSWAEEQLDAEDAIVQAVLLVTESPDDAVSLILGVSVGRLGEMWPFYVAALHRVLTIAGRQRDARDLILSLRAAGLGAQSSQGYSGSVIPMTLALDSLIAGRHAEARAELGQADPTLWQVRLGLVLCDVASGGAARVGVSPLSLSTAVRGLRQAEDWQTMVCVIACFAAGDEERTRMLLEKLVGRPGHFDPVLVPMLSPALAAFAADNVEGWPEHSLPTGALGVDLRDAHERRRIVLTDREREVLAGLVQGKSREAIAKDLFLSANTVKTHQRTLYRKLGASHAQDAVWTADRLGLI